MNTPLLIFVYYVASFFDVKAENDVIFRVYDEAKARPMAQKGDKQTYARSLHNQIWSAFRTVLSTSN